MSKKVCPWYKDGYCLSSLLQQPDNTVTGPHCFEEYKYKTCRYYKEPDQQAKCPWYENGLCGSPKLSKKMPVYRDYCFSDNYKYCPYFLPPKQTRLVDFQIQRQQLGSSDIESSPQTVTKTFKVTEIIEKIQDIYAIDAIPEHACEFLTFISYNSKYYAYCDAINRYLTKSIVQLCITQYQKCPYREYMPT